MERLHRMFAGAGGALGHPPPDSPTLDSSEQVYISSLALLKMLKHGKSRVSVRIDDCFNSFVFCICSLMQLAFWCVRVWRRLLQVERGCRWRWWGWCWGSLWTNIRCVWWTSSRCRRVELVSVSRPSITFFRLICLTCLSKLAGTKLFVKDDFSWIKLSELLWSVDLFSLGFLEQQCCSHVVFLPQFTIFLE